MKKASRIVTMLTVFGISTSGVAYSLTKEMIEKVSDISQLPKNMDSALEVYFKKFSLGIRTKFTGNIGPRAVELKARSSGYDYIEVDISDNESVNRCIGRLESCIDGSDLKKKNKIVVTLKNIDCRNVGHFRTVYNKILQHEDIMLYVHNPLLNCGDSKCKDCLDLIYELKKFSSFEYLKHVTSRGVNRSDAIIMVNDLVRRWKVMRSSGELDVDINLDDEDIDIISLGFGLVNLSDFRDGVRQAFVSSGIRKDNKQPVLYLEDFIKVFMDQATYSTLDLNIDNDCGLQVAIHEMGHAVVTHLLGESVLAVVIRENFDGVTFPVNGKGDFFEYHDTFEGLIKYSKLALAGKLADKLISGYDSDGATSDVVKVKKMLEKAILIKEPMLDPMNYTLLQSKVDELYDEVKSDTEKLIIENSEVIKRMAKRLVDRTPINGLKVMKKSEFLKSFEELTNEIQKENECRARLIEIMKDKKLTDETVSKIEECLKGVANISPEKKEHENGTTVKNIGLKDIKKKSR